MGKQHDPNAFQIEGIPFQFSWRDFQRVVTALDSNRSESERKRDVLDKYISRRNAVEWFLALQLSEAELKHYLSKRRPRSERLRAGRNLDELRRLKPLVQMVKLSSQAHAPQFGLSHLLAIQELMESVHSELKLELMYRTMRESQNEKQGSKWAKFIRKKDERRHTLYVNAVKIYWANSRVKFKGRFGMSWVDALNQSNKDLPQIPPEEFESNYLQIEAYFRKWRKNNERFCEQTSREVTSKSRKT